MGLFSALVGVGIEAMKLPLSVAKDVVELAGTGRFGEYTVRNLEHIKDEAKKADSGR